MSKKVKTDFLNEIVTILQKGLKSQDTFIAVFSLLESTIPYTSATLFLYDEKKDALNVIHQKGKYIADLASEIPFDRGMGISSWVSRQREPVVLESLDKSRPGKEKRFNSFVSIPLWVADKLIGVLNMGHEDPGYYSVAEKEDYRIVGSQISMIVEKINLRSQLEQKNKELTETLEKLNTAQTTLIEKEKLATIGEIAVAVNHEINSPLTSIIGLAEILEIAFNTGNEKKVREGLKGILKQARKIQKVTEKLNNVREVKTMNYHGSTDMLVL
ncbi:MAG: GAF domain-containing protein [Candidatus Marinimicrobia bacterium]|nr:GAF domain-containing protein [Candidatus Neomarinimicrobiota bacterium]